MHHTLSRWLESSAGDDTLVEHPAVHTIEEALRHVPPMPGLMVKNLFVRDEKGRRGQSGSIALANGGALGGGCFILRLP